MLPFQTITFDQLSGVQTNKALTKFRPDEALSCIGGYFNTNGAYTKRKGGVKWNSTSLSNSITGLYDFRYSNDTQQRIIVCAGTQIYNGNAGSPSSIKTGMTAGYYYDFETFNDYCWIVNGADGMLKYDGTTVTNAGITAPSSALTATNVAGAGTLALGTYRVNVTFVNAAGEESNPYSADVTVTLAGADNTINLTNVPTSTDSQVTARNIYLSAAGGTVLRFKQTIADNTTTTATILSAATGALLEYDHDAPVSGLKALEVYKDRLFSFKDDTLYFSKDFDVWYWPTTFNISVGNSDPITGIKSFFDGLLIFKKYDVYILTGDNELNFRIDRVRSDERVGCVADRTISVIGNYCYFLGVNSVYRTNGITIEDAGVSIQGFFDQNYSNDTYKIAKNYVSNACARFFKEKNVYLLFVPAGSSTGTNNMCYAMDTLRISADPESGQPITNWSPWPGFNTQSVAIIVESGVEKWFRGDELGYIFRQEALDGDGSNVTSTATSAGASTLTDSTQSWTINAYAGLTVRINSGTGAGQERTISSNTSTQLTVSSSWTTTPDTTSEYSIGGILYHYQHSWHSYNDPNRSKRLRYIRPRFETSGNYGTKIYFGYDFSSADTDSTTYSVTGISLYDSALYDVGTYDGVAVLQSKSSVPGSRIHRWATVKIENNKSGQPIKYMGHDRVFQMKGIR